MRLTKFDKALAKVSVWIIIVCYLLFLLFITSCHYPNQSNVIKHDKAKKASFR